MVRFRYATTSSPSIDMSLLQFHRLLIACGILFCLGYAGWEVRALLQGGGFGALALAMAFAALGLILSVYLWQLNRWLGYDEGKGGGRHQSGSD